MCQCKLKMSNIVRVTCALLPRSIIPSAMLNFHRFCLILQQQFIAIHRHSNRMIFGENFLLQFICKMQVECLTKQNLVLPAVNRVFASSSSH